jgi:Response regulator containing CheY-like receiver, AAA-type ATPase, and DNA-binding domains
MLSFDDRRKLPSVLLIDDDLVSREVTATVLTLNGYTVHTAEDGAKAFELLDTGDSKPEVILMDAQMPGLSGTELIAGLRERSTARVIVVSGSNPPNEVREAADGFLLKPFGVDALQKLITGVVRVSASGTPSRLDPRDVVINPETLAQFRGMMPAPAVREIYTAVISDLKKRTHTLEGAIAKGNGDEVRRIGHAVKGGCGMAGAIQAARIGALFEEDTGVDESNLLDNRMALLADLRSATRNLERMLEAELPD